MSQNTKLSHAKSKFYDWASKIEQTLEMPDISALPLQCKYLIKWGNVLHEIEPVFFEKEIKNKMFTLLNKSANRQCDEYTLFLKSAMTHKEGTKARFQDLIRYVYYNYNYVLPLYLKTENYEELSKIAKIFYPTYLPLIIEYSLSEDEANWLLSFIKMLQATSVQVPRGLVSIIESYQKKLTGEKELEKQCWERLEAAYERLNQDDTVSALVLADQALESFLRYLCLRSGCDDETINEKGKPFSKWGFIEYMNFLKMNNKIEQEIIPDLYTYHSWRNAVHHQGLEPSTKSVSNVLKRIQQLMEEL